MAVIKRRSTSAPARSSKVERPRDRARSREEEPEEDDEEETRPTRSRTRSSGRTTARRRPREEEPDEDEDDDEDEAPRRSSSRRGTSSKKDGPPPGIRVGLSGAEATSKAGAGGAGRLLPSDKMQLVAFLQNDVFASFRQHWVSAGARQGQRPYVCVGADCPLCALGDKPAAAYCLNILHFTGDGPPESKYLQIGITAWDALREVGSSRKTDKLRLMDDLWTVVHTGKKGGRGQVMFRAVPVDDLEEDWPEVLEQVSLDEIDALIEDAQEDLFDFHVIPSNTRRELKEVAKYLSEDDEDEDEDEDERPRGRSRR